MDGTPKFRPDPDARLLDQVRQVLRYYHYAYRTEATIVPGLNGISIIMAVKPTPGK